MKTGKGTGSTRWTVKELINLANQVINRELTLSEVKEILGPLYTSWKTNFLDTMIQGKKLSNNFGRAIDDLNKIANTKVSVINKQSDGIKLRKEWDKKIEKARQAWKDKEWYLKTIKERGMNYDKKGQEPRMPTSIDIQNAKARITEAYKTMENIIEQKKNNLKELSLEMKLLNKQIDFMKQEVKDVDDYSILMMLEIL